MLLPMGEATEKPDSIAGTTAVSKSAEANVSAKRATTGGSTKGTDKGLSVKGKGTREIGENEKRGEWLDVRYKIIDRHYKKVLRVSAASEGIREGKGGVLGIWVADEEDDDEDAEE